MEMASTYAKAAIEGLLHVHALANMTRSSGNAEYMQTAAGWLPGIEGSLKNMRAEIEKFGEGKG